MNTIEQQKPVTLTLEFKRAARKYCMGQSVYAGRGRTDQPTRVSWATPVRWVPGEDAPKVVGLPYWKTRYSNGRGFSRTLYTPSTMRIVVGVDWKP